MAFEPPNQALGLHKPGLAAIPHLPKKKKGFKAPAAPKVLPAPGLQGLKSAALGGAQGITPGSEGF
jgi:hypothetical protein